MKLLESRILWGIVLILGGIFFLLQNLGFVTLGAIFWSLLLGLGGLFFISVFIQSRENWWGLIPGIALLSIAALIFLSTLFPGVGEALGGAIVLGGIGLAFLAVYLVNRSNWWAIIPMGVMFTLAAVATLDQFGGIETGGIFFLGLGLTFVLVAILPSAEGQMRWAWIPAVVLLVMGLALLAAAEELLTYIWPAILILGGLVLIIRSLGRR